MQIQRHGQTNLTHISPIKLSRNKSKGSKTIHNQALSIKYRQAQRVENEITYMQN